MNNEDMSNIFEQLNNMIKSSSDSSSSTSQNSDVSSNSNDINIDALKQMLNNMSSNNSTNSSTNSDNDSNFNFDINTFIKLKNIMSKMNSANDPRANLLLSLKPYLNSKRKDKLDQYIQFLKISKVLENFDFNGGDSKKC